MDAESSVSTGNAHNGYDVQWGSVLHAKSSSAVGNTMSGHQFGWLSAGTVDHASAQSNGHHGLNNYGSMVYANSYQAVGNSLRGWRSTQQSSWVDLASAVSTGNAQGASECYDWAVTPPGC